MNAKEYLITMWQQASGLELILAVVCGLVVGFIYFQSLRWSVNHINQFKHRIAVFASVAVCRILLFFGVMVAISHHNVVIILLYLLSFFLMKVAIIAYEKERFVKLNDNKKEGE